MAKKPQKRSKGTREKAQRIPWPAVLDKPLVRTVNEVRNLVPRPRYFWKEVERRLNLRYGCCKTNQELQDRYKKVLCVKKKGTWSAEENASLLAAVHTLYPTYDFENLDELNYHDIIREMNTLRKRKQVKERLEIVFGKVEITDNQHKIIVELKDNGMGFAEISSFLGGKITPYHIKLEWKKVERKREKIIAKELAAAEQNAAISRTIGEQFSSASMGMPFSSNPLDLVAPRNLDNASFMPPFDSGESFEVAAFEPNEDSFPMDHHEDHLVEGLRGIRMGESFIDDSRSFRSSSTYEMQVGNSSAYEMQVGNSSAYEMQVGNSSAYEVQVDNSSAYEMQVSNFSTFEFEDINETQSFNMFEEQDIPIPLRWPEFVPGNIHLIYDLLGAFETIFVRHSELNMCDLQYCICNRWHQSAARLFRQVRLWLRYEQLGDRNALQKAAQCLRDCRKHNQVFWSQVENELNVDSSKLKALLDKLVIYEKIIESTI